jgi:hypothetical protein
VTVTFPSQVASARTSSPGPANFEGVRDTRRSLRRDPLPASKASLELEKLYKPRAAFHPASNLNLNGKPGARPSRDSDTSHALHVEGKGLSTSVRYRRPSRLAAAIIWTAAADSGHPRMRPGRPPAPAKAEPAPGEAVVRPAGDSEMPTRNLAFAAVTLSGKSASFKFIPA